MDKNLLKTHGLAFGRSLQKALKIASMYASMDHAATDIAAQQTYGALNPLLKTTREFKIGFLSHRLFLNNVLTTETSLAPLEAEFTKRGVGAVTFEAGVTLAEFKRGLGLLSTPPKALEKCGGLKPLLAQNRFERMRIIPATKQAGEGEDTILTTDPQSYLMVQGMSEGESGASVKRLEPLLDAIGGGAGTGDSLGLGGGGGVLEAVGRALERAVADPERDLHEAVRALTRVFEALKPENILPALAPARQEQLRGRSPEEIAVDFVEDFVAESAGKRLAGMATVDPAAIDDALRLLSRGLKATRLAERLLQKLARFIDEANLPQEVHDRIRQELLWFSLSDEEKHAQFAKLAAFTPQEFRRLVNHLQDNMREGKAEQVRELVNHYFDCVEKMANEAAAEHLGRAKPLLDTLSGPENSDFLRAWVERACRKLRDSASSESHRGWVEGLAYTAQKAVEHEDFKLTLKIGAELERVASIDPNQHAGCCQKALSCLLTSSGAERLVELFLENRDSQDWIRTATGVLRLVGMIGAEKAFERLAEESAASNRLRLLRLIEQLGAPAIEVARRRLGDERWYVVRNACYVLGNLGDADLSNQLRAPLRHKDVRVQQAAVTAIIKNQPGKHAALLADALPYLQAQVLEITLDELTYLKDAATVPGLESFILQKPAAKTVTVEKAVRVLAAISSDQAVEALSRILHDTTLAPTVRRAALVALSCGTSPQSHLLLCKFAKLAETDQLAAECKSILEGPKT